MRHLTDEEIQAYLDGPRGKADADLRQHLETCRQCREALQDYGALYRRLADDAAFVLPPDLADSVLTRMGLEQRRRRLRLPGDLVIVASAIALMLIGISVLGDLGSLFDAASAAIRPILEYSAPHFAAARDRITDGDFTVTILVYGAAILAALWAMDRAFERRRPTTTHPRR
jgi:predicted anti-sigma-YlaC factor YlaD